MKAPTRRASYAGLALALAAVSLLGYGNWPSTPLHPDARADRVIVSKSRHELTLLSRGTILKTYRVALSRNPVGHKQREGDARVPEGEYILDYRNTRSAFHLSLHVSYPLPEQARAARAAGVDPGGLIMVHGLPNGLGFLGRLHRLVDWTNGCIAVTNPEIEEIGRAVPDATPINIRP